MTCFIVPIVSISQTLSPSLMIPVLNKRKNPSELSSCFMIPVSENNPIMSQEVYALWPFYIQKFLFKTKTRSLFHGPSRKQKASPLAYRVPGIKNVNIVLGLWDLYYKVNSKTLYPFFSSVFYPSRFHHFYCLFYDNEPPELSGTIDSSGSRRRGLLQS